VSVGDAGSDVHALEQRGGDHAPASVAILVAVIVGHCRLVGAPAEQDLLPIDLGGEVNQAHLEAEVLEAATDVLELDKVSAQLVIERPHAVPDFLLVLVGRDPLELPPLRQDVVDDALDERQGAVGVGGGELGRHGVIVRVIALGRYHRGMESDERTIELLIEIRDLVREELDEFRSANAQQAAAVEESLARQAQAMRLVRNALTVLLVIAGLLLAWGYLG